jgi:site-specific recombinase XerD
LYILGLKILFMQTTKQTTGLRTAASDYETLVQQAVNKVTGFGQLYKDLERAITVSGKSKSTLTNYARHLAHLALHYHLLPTELDNEQVLDYLHLVKSNGSPSATFFKFTVYGMRYACRLSGLPYQQFSLPAIKRNDKLPVVLNASEVKALLEVCDLLKHRLLIGLVYGCGLRCAEVRTLTLGDVDTERGMVHIRQGKGSKDRCLPMGVMLARGIKGYIAAEKPKKYLFEGKDGNAYSQRGAQWAISQAVKKAGIVKEVSLHTLRHTYATHLLEQGVNILTIKELLGHAHIDTTMVYLHLALPSVVVAFSPMDTLYNRCK